LEKKAPPSRKSAALEEAMTKLIGGAALLFALAGTGSGAQAGPWCAFYDPSTYNCGFHSFEQCLATVRGAGGWCRPNFFEGSSAPRRPTGKRAPEARY
jgi:hypothetical protein